MLVSAKKGMDGVLYLSLLFASCLPTYRLEGIEESAPSMTQRNCRYYDLKLSNLTLTAGFCYPDTAARFGAYCLGESKNRDGLRLPDYEAEIWNQYGLEPDGHFEFSCFTAVISDVLSSHNKGVMHAVGFRFHEKAYLLSAPSGVGKSTMIRTLQEHYPGEFTIISGDRPILSMHDNGCFFVEPSPWNGKENWFGAQATQLYGFIQLRRGDHNKVTNLWKKEAAIPVYNAWIQTLTEEPVIHRFAELSTALIEAAPVYDFVSAGVPDSARFLYETLFAKETEQ